MISEEWASEPEVSTYRFSAFLPHPPRRSRISSPLPGENMFVLAAHSLG